MNIYACPKCGSRNIFTGTMGDGALAGYTTKDVCRNCGYQGSPVIFNSENDYKIFLKKIKNKTSKKQIQKNENKKIKLSKKEKEVVDFLKEYEKEKACKPIWPKNKNWWPEIILALILSVLLTIFEWLPALEIIYNDYF